jgi:glycosyltransferase involved in cell wall biosynthesis
VLIVDDRSDDDTANIVRRLASADDRLRLVQVKQLPEGWTGKTHALQVCQEHARGEWLLFVDADTIQEPSCLSVVMQDCISHQADMETLLPALEVRSFWEGVVQPFAGTMLMLLYPLRKLNDPGPDGKAWGNGQFILMSRTAYDTIGRHEAVRDKFVEDIHLARLIRKHGLGLRVASGSGVSRVRMYASLTDIVRGWSRILYSAVDFRPAKLYSLFLATCAFSVLSYVVLIASGTAWLTGDTSSFVKTAFLMAVAHEIAQLTLHARIYARSHSAMQYLPFRICGVFVVLYILAKTIRMCSTHKVIWRGTSYGQDIQQTE